MMEDAVACGFILSFYHEAVEGMVGEKVVMMVVVLMVVGGWISNGTENTRVLTTSYIDGLGYRSNHLWPIGRPRYSTYVLY